MSYIDGFLLAVPEGNKEKYAALARESWEKVFKPAGALSLHENWGDDVPEGKVTSMPMAVKREPGEVVVFSWVVWPDKATRDKAYGTMQEEGAHEDFPFDGMRMMWGGFVPLVTESV